MPPVSARLKTLLATERSETDFKKLSLCSLVRLPFAPLIAAFGHPGARKKQHNGCPATRRAAHSWQHHTLIYAS